mgnify:CR=1 FL=1
MIDVNAIKKDWLISYVNLRDDISRREHDLVLSSNDNDCFRSEDIYTKKAELSSLKQTLSTQTDILLSMVANQDFVHRKIIEYYYVRNLKLQTIATMLGYSMSYTKTMKRNAIESLDARYIDV